MITLANYVFDRFIERFKKTTEETIEYDRESLELLYALYESLPGATYEYFMSRLGVSQERLNELNEQLYEMYLQRK